MQQKVSRKLIEEHNIKRERKENKKKCIPEEVKADKQTKCSRKFVKSQCNIKREKKKRMKNMYPQGSKSRLDELNMEMFNFGKLHNICIKYHKCGQYHKCLNTLKWDSKICKQSLIFLFQKLFYALLFILFLLSNIDTTQLSPLNSLKSTFIPQHFLLRKFFAFRGPDYLK